MLHIPILLIVPTVIIYQVQCNHNNLDVKANFHNNIHADYNFF